MYFNSFFLFFLFVCLFVCVCCCYLSFLGGIFSGYFIEYVIEAVRFSDLSTVIVKLWKTGQSGWISHLEQSWYFSLSLLLSGFHLA